MHILELERNKHKFFWKKLSVLSKFIKILQVVIGAGLIFCLPTEARAYDVSGIVSFGYQNLETKIGDNISSSHYWTQDYNVNTAGILWDPRFLRYNAGVGYRVTSLDDGSDIDSIFYNVSASFFPGRKISWNIFGNRSINNVQDSSIAGTDINTTSYGVTFNLDLTKNGRGRNNNNNNFGPRYIPLPYISLSRLFTESETLNSATPLHETRDGTKATINYRLSSAATINLDGGLEEYENLTNKSSYSTKTANLSSNIQLSPIADMNISGNMTDRKTYSITGFDAFSDTWLYSFNLNFKEKNRLRHTYSYRVTETESPSSDTKGQYFSAMAFYKIIEGLDLRSSINYSVAEYKSSTDESTLKSGGAEAGILYAKKYKPDFMGPFVLNTSYDFGYGFSDYSSKTSGIEGSGNYYSNNFFAGLNSEGWKQENLSLSYNFNSRRDDSVINNDTKQNAILLSANTSRIPKTNIRATANYSTYETQQVIDMSAFYAAQGINQSRRSLTYSFDANHALSYYINLNIGATRGQIKNNYTLSTLQPENKDKIEDTMYYGSANLTYPITRLLVYRAVYREEYRNTDSIDSRNRQVNMNLDYRIRQIFVNFEYRWRQDIPENTLRTTQQYYFVKLTRPF